MGGRLAAQLSWPGCSATAAVWRADAWQCTKQPVCFATHQAPLLAAKLSVLRHPAAAHLPTTVNVVLEGCQHHFGLSRLKIAAHDDLSSESCV